MSETKHHQCPYQGCNFKTKNYKRFDKHLDKCTTMKVNTGSYPRMPFYMSRKERWKQSFLSLRLLVLDKIGSKVRKSEVENTDSIL